MKPKNLVVMVVVLAVLAGLVQLNSLRNKPANIAEEVRFTAMVPEELRKEDIARIEMYSGGNVEEKLVVARAQTDEGWEATSYFDAPVKDKKIDDFLDLIIGLQGEYRATADTDAALETYDITEEAGFHISGYKADSEDAAFHIVVGKSPNYGNVFVRDVAGDEIYVANANFRQKAGVYSSEGKEPVKPNIWLDKNILKLDREKIRRIEIGEPDKTVVLENREKAAEESAEGEGESESEPTPPEREWVVASGGIGSSLNQTGIDTLLRKLANFNASKIVDPTKLEDWKLSDPQYITLVSLEGEDNDVVIEGGQPVAGGIGYIRVSSNKKDIVYSINRYDFEQIYPKGSQLFDLPGLAEDEKAITRVEYSTPEGSVLVVKSRNSWAVEKPEANLPLVDSAISTMTATLADWKSDDYSDHEDGTGLAEPTRIVTFTGEGFSHTIEVGESPAFSKGHYARLDGDEQILMMTDADSKKIFVPAKDLYERSLFDINEEEIVSVDVNHGETAYRLEKDGSSWTIIQGDQKTQGDANRLDDYTYHISILEAEDLEFGAAMTPGITMATVNFRMQDGMEYALTVKEEVNGLHPVTLKGTNVRFLLAKDEIGRVLVDPKELEPKPQEPDESDEGETPASDNSNASLGPADETAPGAVVNIGTSPSKGSDSKQ